MTSLSVCSVAIFGLHQPMASINQNRYPNLLPNFRNLGVMLRLLVIVIAMTFVAAALKSSNWYDMLDQWLGISTLAQPMVILSLLLLALADLFRVLMADNRDLVPLVREVELCHQYLGLEALRLGDRLRVEWQVDGMPGGALVPPLLLQPLLENAVYHGIEPSMEPGVISIHISNDRDRVHMLLRNPFRAEGSHHAGNKMALANIRERLSLHFDAEASLQTRTSDGHYEVRITLPYVKEGK